MTDYKRHVHLSWKILENKIMYYQPRELSEKFINANLIPDEQYDALEIEYLTLCHILKVPNTLVHKEYPNLPKVDGAGMMEVDWSRPSVMMVYDTLMKKSLKDVE
jgi:hypothetical protein